MPADGMLKEELTLESYSSLLPLPPKRPSPNLSTPSYDILSLCPYMLYYYHVSLLRCWVGHLGFSIEVALNCASISSRLLFLSSILHYFLLLIVEHVLWRLDCSAFASHVF